MAEPFDGFDLAAFWQDSRFARETYRDLPPSDAVIAAVEHALGHLLPPAYVALARHRNGGTPARCCHRTSRPTSWAEDHVAITGIMSIGGTKPSSLLGRFGSRFWIEDWGYPAIGVYFADCPSAGHDMLCLDYRACGPQGEPQIVHVDQERDYRITPVATDFEAFIRGLAGTDAFGDDT